MIPRIQSQNNAYLKFSSASGNLLVKESLNAFQGIGNMSKPGSLLRTFDYHTLGQSVLAQSKFIYGGLVVSRMLFSRTKNERLESLRRDPFAWYCWFYGKPLLEWATITFSTAADPLVRHMLHRNIPEMGHPFNPPSQIFQATLKQLDERKSQLLKRMKAAKAPAVDIRQMSAMFKRAKNMRLLTSAMSMGFTILALGIGINFLNIAATRRNLLLKQLEDNSRNNHRGG